MHIGCMKSVKIIRYGIMNSGLGNWILLKAWNEIELEC